MMTGDRFHPVRINRYIGDYTGRYLCWAIADREQANRVCTADRCVTRAEAQTIADRMNAQPAEESSCD